MLAYVHASVLRREQLEPRPFWLKLLTTPTVLFPPSHPEPNAEPLTMTNGTYVLRS